MRKLNKRFWPYQTIAKNADTIVLWCAVYAGDRFRDWHSYANGDGRTVFAFREQETLTAFKLRWGNHECN